MLKRCSVVALPVLVGVLALATPSFAQNLLTNPGFETGTLAGWTDAGNLGWNTVTTVPHTGTFGISNGAVGSLSLLRQTIATTPGNSYEMCGWVRSTGASHYQMRFGATTVFPDTVLPAGPYTQICGIATAGGASTVVEYGFRDDPSFVNFDDASVIQTIPEPGSYALIGIGLASTLMLAVRRRIRRK